jgi:predicted phage tail protein
MRRKVILEGDLGEKFGHTLTVDADTHQQILKCIEANRPGFRAYLMNCIDNNTGFIIDIAGKNIEKEEDLLIPVKEGDVTILAVPAGSKKGMGKILAAVAIASLIIASAGTAVAGAEATFGAKLAAGMGKAAVFSNMQLMGLSLSVNLALAGMQQMMAPDPAVDEDAPTNYLYSGTDQNITEGDPVPVLYGELRVPGRTIGVDIIQGRYRNNNVVIDNNTNDLILVEGEMAEELA